MKISSIKNILSVILLVMCIGCQHKESVDERIARQEREAASKELIKETYRNAMEQTQAKIDSLESAHRKGAISERDYQLNTAVQKKVYEEWESKYYSVDLD